MPISRLEALLRNTATRSYVIEYLDDSWVSLFDLSVKTDFETETPPPEAGLYQGQFAESTDASRSQEIDA